MRYPCIIYNHVNTRPFELHTGLISQAVIAMTEMEFIHFLVSVNRAMEACANATHHPAQ